ncbi:MAG TPA: phenylacetic acid degradation protein PaaI, partial [Deltaproteobacteria bacterium]|nr:phenylacetic acid degradation protein PaaI [Deltaproteobacteria bacterium]
MKIQNDDYRRQVEGIFEKAPFLKNLGLKLHNCGPGWCESFLEVQNYHKQQNRLVHAGVIATLADHTAGGAALTLIA